MPAFRNVKSRRSSGRIWKQEPVVYDEHGWECPPQAIDYSIDYPLNLPPSPHSSVTSPSIASADSDFEAATPVRKNKGKGRATDPDHVPRPKNAFIFYRSYFYQTLGGNDQNQISVAAGRAWKLLPAEEKMPFQLMAEEAKREHMIKYPHYTYAPGNKGSSKRKAAPKKKPQPSSKKALLSRRSSRRESLANIPIAFHRQPPPTQVALPTLHHPSPIAPNASQQVFDLTVDEPSSDNIYPGFTPQDQIPPLDLSACGSESVKFSLLERSEVPLNFDYTDSPFSSGWGFPLPEPATVEGSLFPQAEPQEEHSFPSLYLQDYSSSMYGNTPMGDEFQWAEHTRAFAQCTPMPTESDHLSLGALRIDLSHMSPYASTDAAAVYQTPEDLMATSSYSSLEMEKYVNYFG